MVNHVIVPVISSLFCKKIIDPFSPGLSVGRVQWHSTEFHDDHITCFGQYNMGGCKSHHIRAETLTAFQSFTWPCALVFSDGVTFHLGPRMRKPGTQGKLSTAES